MREDNNQRAGLLDDLLNLCNDRVSDVEFPPIDPNMDLREGQMYSKLVNKVPIFVRVTDENRHGKAPKALYLLEVLVFTKLPTAN
jgi:hypothetical protein